MSEFTHSESAEINPLLSGNPHSACWITHPDADPNNYGIYHFRKRFNLPIIPQQFFINISADNRYRLFVNGNPVCSGPACSDLSNWYFETIDIAAFLKQNDNLIAVVVWNFGEHSPTSQMSYQTACFLQGNINTAKLVDTDANWNVMINTAYSPCSLNASQRLDAYMAVGPGDRLEGAKYPWGWETNEYNDDAWSKAKEITNEQEFQLQNEKRWYLTPRNIPIFKEHLTRFPVIRRTGIKISEDFVLGKTPLLIPPYQSVYVLFDQLSYTVAYPELIVSGGKRAYIQLTYAESLYNDKKKKGNRNEVFEKEIYGSYDIFHPDGGRDRKFRPLWFRAYRYLQLNIITQDQGLVLQDLYNMTTGYPLEMSASFSCNDAELQDIWEVGWHTAKMCAGEVYYDTPYYEQLQYAGDSRIQALISLYISGDDRLMRKTILDFYHSQTEEGLTQSRYPSNRLQLIPAFSLFWVTMVYDYWMHRTDDEFVKQFLPAIQKVILWFSTRIDQKTKMLQPLAHWNFTDWSDAFDELGVAYGSENESSSIIALQYAATLNQAAGLFRYFKDEEQAEAYSKLAKETGSHTFTACYNAKEGLIADTPSQQTYSQHAGIWAILSGSIPKSSMKKMVHKLLNNTAIGQVTFFYRFYLIQALKNADMADLYYSELLPWRNMLKQGLTTFAEKQEPARSDCHAWSASPNYDFLATICGIMPETAGFKTVLIKPFLGELTQVNGSMPHPSGTITVSLSRNGADHILAEITLPEDLSGTFIWKGQKIKLTGGKQLINSKER